MDIFSASASANYVRDHSLDWERQNTSFDSQLNELNTYSSSDVEWQRSGNIIIPKTINVAKVVKSMMSRNLVFSRVKREYYDAPFQRSFSLSTFSVLNLPSYYVDYVQQQAKLDKQVQTLSALISVQNKQIANVTVNLTAFFQNQIALLGQNFSSQMDLIFSSLKSRIDSADLSIRNLQSQINTINSRDFSGLRTETGTWTIQNPGPQATLNFQQYSTFSKPFQNAPMIFINSYDPPLANLKIQNQANTVGIGATLTITCPSFTTCSGKIQSKDCKILAGCGCRTSYNCGFTSNSVIFNWYAIGK